MDQLKQRKLVRECAKSCACHYVFHNTTANLLSSNTRVRMSIINLMVLMNIAQSLILNAQFTKIL